LSRHQICLRPSDVSDSTRSVEELLATISRMDYVVTCRFHGVVFAHLLNKPVLAIAHHPKVSDLMAELDLSAYCVDIMEFDSTSLTEKFSSMVDNAEDIRLRMAASLTNNRLQLRRQFDELFRSSMKTAPASERRALCEEK
jgi:polysaccharide pyruvyl transferase WcaK-like protein